MVEIVNKRGRKANVPQSAARVLVKSGRFSYLTASVSEPIQRTEAAAKPTEYPTTATLEPAEPPKKRGRPKKVKDADTP